MASNSSRGGLLTVGGILSIVAGISQLILGGVLVVDFLVSYQHCGRLIYALFLPGLPDAWRHYILWGSGAIPFYMGYVPIRWAIIGGCVGVLGIVAIVGGISAIRRKKFGLSLAGAICALPSVIFGILAVIFVALGERGFGAERKEMASNGDGRVGLLRDGGVLSIVAGIYLIVVGMSVAYRLLAAIGFVVWYYSPFPPFLIYSNHWWWLYTGGFVSILGIVAIVGGISAVRRRRFGLSLAGAICALPSVILGIPAVIFIAKGKREFRTVRD